MSEHTFDDSLTIRDAVESGATVTVDFGETKFTFVPKPKEVVKPTFLGADSRILGMVVVCGFVALATVAVVG